MHANSRASVSHRFIVESLRRMNYRPVTRGGAGGQTPLAKFLAPLEKCAAQWAWFKTIGHGLKNLGPSQEILRPTRCPKLITGLMNYPTLF